MRHDTDIDLRLPDDDTLERLAVRQVGEDLFEVCCLPFALYDVCLGDVIQVAGLSVATPGTVTGKAQDAGRFLFRISLIASPVDMQSAASTSVSMGDLVESYGHVVLAVDAPTSDEAEVLAAYLQVREEAGDWKYENGR